MPFSTHAEQSFSGEGITLEKAVDAALDRLQQESEWPEDRLVAFRAACKSVEEKRSLLGDLLISCGAQLSETLLSAVDVVYTIEASYSSDDEQLVDESLPGLRVPCGTAEIVIWRGDMRRLKVDVVVNAANESGLGCFQPSHKCIDNILHRAAGPRMRKACRECMTRRAIETTETNSINIRGSSSDNGSIDTREFPTSPDISSSPLQSLSPPSSSIQTKISSGRLRPPRLLEAGSEPIVTPAYHLPAKAVCHVTGPQITDPRRFKRGPPSKDEEEKLANVYREVLSAVSALKMRSVSFCCISTGLFGYPSRAAATTALLTVKQWLTSSENDGHSIDLVVFDVFTDEDELWYTQLTPQLL